MRVRIVQALAIVALLHTLTPALDPAQVGLDALEEHYGETVSLEGRVAQVDPNGEVVRLLVVSEEGEATVLTRQAHAPLGANVSLRGQPTPGRSGPVVWADGALEVQADAGSRGRVPLAQLLHEAPRLAGGPVTVTGTWSSDRATLASPAGTLPVDAASIAPEAGPVLLWGRLVYEPAGAGYELEATGWRPWTPPGP